MKILVTGGAGFIGSAFVRKAAMRGDDILILDKMTYAASQNSIWAALELENVNLVEIDLCNASLLRTEVQSFKPDKIIHFAAETHVDNSIAMPDQFVQSNIVGTFNLLREALDIWIEKREYGSAEFRFHHISTDEVYGELELPEDAIASNNLFTENTPYSPRSPYSASKAAADHLVRAWYHTFNLPVTLSNCSNNFGPYQHAEKLVPKAIQNALACKEIPIYGDGKNIRDWLYVEDHIDAIDLILKKGRPGETYNIGASCERSNIQIVSTILELVEDIQPINSNLNNVSNLKSYKELITFVKDRPGHDLRYAIDATKIKEDLGWQPRNGFNEALSKTVKYFVRNSHA